MAYNKIEANGETLIDLTSDTVTADTLVSGRTAHLASGEKVTGTFEPVTGVKGNAESAYRTGDVNLTPANLGLGNVNNTSDLDKPISTATQAALDSQQEQINYNTNNGVKNLLSFSDIYTSDSTYFDSIAFDKLSGAIQATVKNGRAYSSIDFPLTSLTLIDGKQYTMSAVVNSKTLPESRMTLRRTDTYRVIYTKSLNIGYNKLDFTFNASDFPNGYYVSIILTENTSQSGSIDISEYMVKESIIDDDTFEPYAKSNAELTQDLDDISEELDCLTIQAALVNNEVIIQNTSDFTNELYSKYFSYTKPKFAILKLQITSNTYYYKALLNSSSVSQGNLMEASFITVANGEYIYNFTWVLSGTVGTPTVTRKALNLGS